MKKQIIIQLPEFPKEQLEINSFLKKSKNKPEQERINLAKNLYTSWKEKNLIKELFPGVPERNDYWFLTQVLAQSQLYTMERKITEFSYLPKKVEFIKTNNNKVDRSDFALPNFQEALVLNHLGLIEISQKPIALSQLRLEPNTRPLQLFCGHKDLGGIQYIDGVPKNKNYPITPRYLIRAIR